jgi:hypothetical protein
MLSGSYRVRTFSGFLQTGKLYGIPEALASPILVAGMEFYVAFSTRR